MSLATENATSPSLLLGVMINGERRQVPADLTVSGLLLWLEVEADRVAIELNRTIVRKRDWSGTPVPQGSEIEIVEFVGGG